ncbi:MAG: cytidylate kinase family protein [Elusimicrobia bacterium]|nr:cytidylate kinase family protein [Elusimicrobiota bacterium]
MPIITISRGCLSGGELLAEHLGAKLGAKVFSREVIVAAAKKFGVSEAELAEGVESPPGLWDRFTKHKERYLLAVQAALAGMIEEGDCVYHGHAGQLLLKELPCIIKLRLIAPLEYRVKSAVVEFGYTREEALSYLEQMDYKRERWVRQLYGVEWADPALYDMVINLEHMAIEAAADLVVALGKREEYRRTPERDRTIRDFALRTRVRAALALQSGFPDGAVEIVAQDGVIAVSGGPFFEKNRHAVVEFVRSIPGVKEIAGESVKDAGKASAAAPAEKTASDIMLPLRNYPSVREGTTIREAFGALSSSSVKLKDGHLMTPRYVLVVDEDGRLAGIIGRRDLLRGLLPHFSMPERVADQYQNLASHLDFNWVSLFSRSSVAHSKEPVKTIASPIVGAVRPDDSVSVVVSNMIRYKIDLVPVVDKERAVGVVLMTEVFDSVAEFVLEQGR